MINPMNSDRAARALRAAVLIAAVAYTALFVAVAARRAGYPFELEWMEGGSVDHVARVVAGVPIYAAPSVDFIAYIYPPVYYYAAAAVASVVGEGFLPLRLVSIAAALGVFALLFATARRETGSARFGLLACGLFAASFAAGGGWFDLGRVDSLFLLFAVVAAYLLRFHTSRSGFILAGTAIALAYNCKQTALIALAPLVLYVCWKHRRLAPWLLGTALIGIAGGYVLFTNIFGEWYAYYVYRIPAGHALLWSELIPFWTRDMLPAWGVACLGVVAYLFGRDDEAQASRPRGFHVSLLVGMTAAAWISRMHIGGYINVLMPLHCALALVFPIALHHLIEQRRRLAVPMGAEALAYAACLVQFCVLYYNPRAFIPSQADREAGVRVVATLAACEGPVLVPEHGYWGALAGKQSNAQAQALLDVLRSGDTATSQRLLAELNAAIADRRYGAVLVNEGAVYDRVTPGHDWLTTRLAAAYGRPDTLKLRPDVLLPVVGMKTRPHYLFRRARE